MTYSLEVQEEALSKVRSLFEEVSRYSDVHAVKNYHEGLLDAKNKCLDSTELNIRKKLFEYWVQCAMHHLAHPDLVGLSAEYYDGAMEIACQEGVLEYIMEHTITSQQLAYICTKRAGMAGGLRAVGPSLFAMDLLDKWAGCEVDPAVLNSIEGTASLIYGPAAWSIFRSEVESEQDLPAYLLQQEVPLAGVVNPAGQAIDKSILPLDLT